MFCLSSSNSCASNTASSTSDRSLGCLQCLRELCALASLQALLLLTAPKLVLPPVPALLLLDFVFLFRSFRMVCGHDFLRALILPLSLNAVFGSSLVSNSEMLGPILAHSLSLLSWFLELNHGSTLQTFPLPQEESKALP